jgi:hypothetical protein
MTVDHDLAALCRAARNAALDTSPAVVAFTAGLLARGPIEPEALVERLEVAGITPARWRAAAEEFAPSSVLVTARRRIRATFLRRHAATGWFR